MGGHRYRPQVSLIVPFRADSAAPHRVRLWEWLREYWSWEMPDAEIVMGSSKGKVFSKTRAVNSAVKKSHGRILVILDSDVYLRGHTIRHCADTIDVSLRNRHPLWFIPYRRLYRLTEVATERVLVSEPRFPVRFPSPPDSADVGSTTGSMHGHRYGAMIQMMPRVAFDAVGGMDPRFRGWGGEDVAFVRALDTLYGKHKTSSNDVLHLWHANIGADYKSRMWDGQKMPGRNENLAQRYNFATGDRAKMRALVDEARTR